MQKENRGGVLHIDGCSIEELAREYATPLYVLSETEIVNRFTELKRTFLEKYENTRVAYACKALCTTAMIKLCEREGVCIDVVSGGELYTAIEAGFPSAHIEFNGNNKLPAEIEMAVDYNIGRIIVDGLQELELVERICKKKNRKMKILIRVTPGVAADSHDYIITGKKDSKFGVPVDENVLYPLVLKSIRSPHLDFLGFHFHIGSQLFDNSVYLQAIDIILDKAKDIREKYGYTIQELNLGGGYGATYTNEQRRPFSYFLDPMMKRIQEFCAEQRMKVPAVVIEPGRSIVAEAGLTVYTIGTIKEIKGVRKYVSVDGGMGDNIRPALYQAEYDGVVANKMNEPCTDKVTVCGKYCESGDLLIKNIEIPANTVAGDLFAVYSTGAYGYAMASNYNNNPIPAMVLVKEGESSVIVMRQSYKDVIRNNVTPDYWGK